jgi:predicted nucleic acid-binding protein
VAQAVVDTGPLYATIDTNDAHHVRSLEVLQRGRYELIVPAMVVAEVSYLVGERLGPIVEARFLESLRNFAVIAPHPDDWSRIAVLVRRYGDFPLGGTDASVIALAERLDTDLIVTLDQRHFRAVRPRHCDAFRLLP